MAPSEDDSKKKSRDENPFVAFRRLADERVSSLCRNVLGFGSSFSNPYQTPNTSGFSAIKEKDLSGTAGARCPYRPVESDATDGSPPIGTLSDMIAAFPEQWYYDGDFGSGEGMFSHPFFRNRLWDGFPMNVIGYSKPYSPSKLEDNKVLRERGPNWRNAFEDLMTLHSGQEMVAESQRPHRDHREWKALMIGLSIFGEMQRMKEKQEKERDEPSIIEKLLGMRRGLRILEKIQSLSEASDTGETAHAPSNSNPSKPDVSADDDEESSRLSGFTNEFEAADGKEEMKCPAQAFLMGPLVSSSSEEEPTDPKSNGLMPAFQGSFPTESEILDAVRDKLKLHKESKQTATPEIPSDSNLTSPSPKNRNNDADEDSLTELDIYEYLDATPPRKVSLISSPLPHSTFASQENSPKPTLISLLTTTHRHTLPDGTVHTKTVLKKRFADGSEESEESNQTTHAPDTSATSTKPSLSSLAPRAQEETTDETSKTPQKKKGGWFWS
ncbi:hypothetical protein MMC20_001063 [Loxospora ochrophaea]|nr:hypothetical protein [Loxospora ochrophaea]